MNRQYYNCKCYVGNMANLETEMKKNSMNFFLKSFLCKDFKVEKIESDELKNYYYEFNIEFSDTSFSKVRRFSDALVSFCLFWKISIKEK